MDNIDSLGKYVVDMELFVGPSGADSLVVFIPGWPDTRELFDPYWDAVKAKFAVLSFTVPGFERPPFKVHPDWPHDGFAWPLFYKMLHRFIEEQKAALVAKGVSVKDVFIVGHDFGAVHAHALDWLYEGSYKKIVAFDVGPVLEKFDSKNNIIISCYQTQFSRYHMGNRCANCICYQPVWVKNFLAFGGAPKPLMERPEESWMGSTEFWTYGQMYPHWFASTFGLCACCCCTPCSLGCCKTWNFTFSSQIYDVNSNETYLKHRAAKGHNMFFYSSPTFANPDFIAMLGSDAIKCEGGHWHLVPESKGGIAKPEIVAMINEKMVEFLSRS